MGADFDAPPNAGDAVRLIGADDGKYPKLGSPGLCGGPGVWNV